MIERWWVAVVLVWALLGSVEVASFAGNLHQELIEAVARGDSSLVTALVDNGADFNAKDEYGRTALTQASARGDLETVKLLLGKGADVKVNASSGWPALTKAAGRGDLEMVRLFLDRRAPPNAKDWSGSTALIEASVRGQKGHLAVIELLLQKGANIDAKDKLRWTALMWSVWYSHLEVVKTLLAKGADVNAMDGAGTTAVMQACARDHQLRALLYRELWQLFLSVFQGKTWGPTYPSGQNDVEVLKLLLEKGADVNAKSRDGWTALNRAQRRGASEIVELLKAHGGTE
jgi:ankyrin repeat protein